MRKYEAEVKAVHDSKERERALAEWQAEQEKEATLALLDPAEAQRQRDRYGGERGWGGGVRVWSCVYRCMCVCVCVRQGAQEGRWQGQFNLKCRKCCMKEDSTAANTLPAH